ncbi:MAG: hypothetical protein V1732_00330 [Patescibacteria group bacterium]
MEINEKKFNLARQEAERYYESIGLVKCPYLKCDVHFNTEGFQHLLFKSWNRTRSRAEQYTRLRLISLAPKIISLSHTLQEYNECKVFARQKINSRWESKLKIIHYYVFAAIIKDVRIKIVVKEIKGGVKFFYSLYPSWKVVKDINGKKRKKFYSGDPETD